MVGSFFFFFKQIIHFLFLLFCLTESYVLTLWAEGDGKTERGGEWEREHRQVEKQAENFKANETAATEF